MAGVGGLIVLIPKALLPNAISALPWAKTSICYFSGRMLPEVNELESEGDLDNGLRINLLGTRRYLNR